VTIAAAYLTSEGVVFGADSATTINITTQGGEGGIAQLFNNEQKIFEVGPPKQGRVALCTWGMGRIGSVSHRTISARLADMIEADTTVEDALQRLQALVASELTAAAVPAGTQLGYFLGGWDGSSHLPRCYELNFTVGAEPEIKPLTIGEARFSGAPEFFSRVLRGFDPKLPGLLLDALKRQVPGLPAAFDAGFTNAFNAIAGQLFVHGHRDLPIREAIDFLHMYLHLTVKAFKFRYGPPVCGGPIEIGFISTDRFFRWVRHKDFDSAL
jgi:hypothetical protein